MGVWSKLSKLSVSGMCINPSRITRNGLKPGINPECPELSFLHFSALSALSQNCPELSGPPGQEPRTRTLMNDRMPEGDRPTVKRVDGWRDTCLRNMPPSYRIIWEIGKKRENWPTVKREEKGEHAEQR